jgi:hypothetical protein
VDRTSKLRQFLGDNIKYIFFSVLAVVIIGLMICDSIKYFFPSITYHTYEITELYLLDVENFCTFTKNEDGGEELIVLPIEKTIIYPANDERQYVEIEIAEEGTTKEYTIMIKVYISKTLDEIEYLK